MFKQADSSNNQKQSACFFAPFAVKFELVFGLTQKHASSQRFLTMTKEENVTSSAKLY